MLRVPEIKLSLDQDEKSIKKEIAKKLHISEETIKDYRIFKKSIDARKKNDVHFVYAVDIDVEDEERILRKHSKKGVIKVPELKYVLNNGNPKDFTRPVVVGLGPAGLFAGLTLAQMGLKPIILERGKSVDERAKDIELFWEAGKLNTESNVQFGEGGAGTFSDGKLTTLIKDPRCRKVLEEFVAAGAPEEILYLNKPHIGTDILREVVKNIRKTIIFLGGEVRFNSKLTDLLIEDQKIVGVKINDSEILKCDKVLIALGHSARDTFYMLYEKGIEIKQKGFSIGVRIEHPQKLINESQYGEFAGHQKLGAADYKLSGHLDNGRSAYTFCMCPGGVVVGAASEENMIVTNGMSYHARDKENANSALLVGITPEDFGSEHPLAGVEFQRKWEKLAFEVGGGNYKAPAQKVGDFLINKPSTSHGDILPSFRPGVKMTDLRLCLPDYVSETINRALLLFDKKIKGYANPDAIMTGVETRSSSPIRIQRDENMQANIRGIYPVGEGAGYAGGIISAAVDGIRVAEKVVSG
ncbi:NAD(P)/FAD-dependent oxidoreductase [Tissierella sp. Yu-01]|uniref:NAD(P)/FAD-dependent oxidoreductase n=1 Tax=Tissierella sp. Yu-01 TaxID=3035694 RepID=UPI00240E8B18|nr:NAD(P)/FAD-dependent oxidoreductase [Tissierella sp. Yu-01]WFA08205.1 NAD(P)/FAD-dependent oxidoreductase [Tissierella sp. Yu-01]